MISRYEITSIDNIVCLPGTGILRAVVSIDKNLDYLMPYINGYVKGAIYISKIPWIRFAFRCDYRDKGGNYQVAIKGKEIIVAKFTNRDEAVACVKKVIDFINYIDSMKEKITPSSREWQPPKVMEICKNLPMTNCRKCGCLSCMAFATKLIQEEIDLKACTELTEERYKNLATLLHLED